MERTGQVDDLLIRTLKIGDVEALSRITSSIIKKPTVINFKRIIEEQSKSSGVQSFVAELRGSVVGYMISYTLSGGFGIDKSAWIAIVGVDPRFMGQGIGKALAEETFRYYKEQGIRNIYTSVRWDSTDMLSFFKTLGFDRSNFINLTKVLK
jgi:ribosomal protein S18 acetylase RimI-like enzyme